ncbi:hybrid sensor histidine kinase/response regulator [Caulobacter sp. D4A]|uniref:ATP-binding protein n=1 Tax=unclassified Caulobacter TaxID=2648921 RepID=UPI000D73F2BD|nr:MULTISPECIES: ATP-binding protein [unclassified Caulobacter]PXA77331.1 hybrid sensor histidine kinase/response regulator [Caulobacter sp. D4A]PXA91644.1 hybrid sensor histidine kinase/response regulator [Caulobacter sp. D5]
MDDTRHISETSAHAPLQARIAGVALGTTIAALTAACLCFMLQQWSVARQEARENHRVLAEMVAAGAAASLADHNAVGASRALDAVIKAPHVAGARLTDTSGQIVARIGVENEDNVETLTRPVTLSGRKVGELSLVARQPSLVEILARDLALTGALFFGAAGLAILLANSLARRMTKPMQRLSDAMHDMAQGGRYSPVQQASDDDVFHSLTDSFNHLVARLEANDHDLRSAMGELVKARDDANAANVLKSHFLANMSHEIRTPLNGVLAMTEVMAMDDLSSKQRERLSVIRESGGLLLAVLNDVLDLSKIEAGRLELVERDFDLSALASSLRETFVDQARDKGLDFGVMVAPEALGGWHGDVDRLRQILNNLVSNALKFTLEGAVSVRFASAEDGSGLRIDVTDTGIGIAADILPRLFDKFVQADSSTTRRFGGSGLGLSICRELAAVMGGGIHVQSREGQGSTFTVVVAMPRGEGEIAQAAPVDEPSDAAAGRRLRVLAADDNLTNQKVIAAVLAPLGAEVALVADGAACVEAWRSGGHDVILMDIHMPVMDGVEAARTIRSLEAAEGRARTPIVAVTANALVHQVEGYLAAGMDGHVAKPIEVTKLYAAIEDAVAAAARMAAAA